MYPLSYSGTFASKIMSKYGWEEGKGLGKESQGISTALSVEKTSWRGGKIVNTAAEKEAQAEQDRQREQSMVDLMKNPTRVVLLQVCITIIIKSRSSNLSLSEHGWSRGC